MKLVCISYCYYQLRTNASGRMNHGSFQYDTVPKYCRKKLWKLPNIWYIVSIKPHSNKRHLKH